MCSCDAVFICLCEAMKGSTMPMANLPQGTIKFTLLFSLRLFQSPAPRLLCPASWTASLTLLWCHGPARPGRNSIPPQWQWKMASQPAVGLTASSVGCQMSFVARTTQWQLSPRARSATLTLLRPTHCSQVRYSAQVETVSNILSLHDCKTYFILFPIPVFSALCSYRCGCGDRLLWKSGCGVLDCEQGGSVLCSNSSEHAGILVLLWKYRPNVYFDQPDLWPVLLCPGCVPGWYLLKFTQPSYKFPVR